MRPFIGSILFLGMIGAPAWVVWRITRGAERWFAESGAGDIIMWTLVVCVVLLLLGLTAAILAGASGLAARAWVVRLDEGQYLESTAHALQAPARPHVAQGRYTAIEALAERAGKLEG